jgi:hypothetical protein
MTNAGTETALVPGGTTAGVTEQGWVTISSTTANSYAGVAIYVVREFPDAFERTVAQLRLAVTGSDRHSLTLCEFLRLL